MASWQVQDAKARFSEFLDATIKKGPQVVTRRGVKTAVHGADRRMGEAAKSRPAWAQGPGCSLLSLVATTSSTIEANLRSRPVVEFE